MEIKSSTAVRTKRVLALDCSTDHAALSFCEQTASTFRAISSRRTPIAKLGEEGSANEGLVCVLADFLGDVQCWLPDVDVWAVGSGPGPGPWISESLNFMRRMANSTRRPLRELSSLKLLALGAFHGSQAGLGAVVVAIQRSSTPGRFWAGAYRPGDPLETVLEDREYSLEGLRETIIKAKKSPSAKVRLSVPSLAVSAPAWVGIGSGYFELAFELRDVLVPLPSSELERPLLPSTFMLAHEAVK